jgi:hypothetical protein
MATKRSVSKQSKLPASNSEGFDEVVREFGRAINRFSEILPSIFPNADAVPYLQLGAQQIRRRTQLILAHPISKERLASELATLQRAVQTLHAQIEDLNLQSLAATHRNAIQRDVARGMRFLTLPRKTLLRTLDLATADPLSLASQDRLFVLRTLASRSSGIGIIEFIQRVKDVACIIMLLLLLLEDPELLEFAEEDFQEFLDWIEYIDDIIEWFGPTKDEGKTTDRPPTDESGPTTDPPPKKGVEPPPAKPPLPPDATPKTPLQEGVDPAATPKRPKKCIWGLSFHGATVSPALPNDIRWQLDFDSNGEKVSLRGHFEDGRFVLDKSESRRLCSGETSCDHDLSIPVSLVASGTRNHERFYFAGTCTVSDKCNNAHPRIHTVECSGMKGKTIEVKLVLTTGC